MSTPEEPPGARSLPIPELPQPMSVQVPPEIPDIPEQPGDPNPGGGDATLAT